MVIFMLCHVSFQLNMTSKPVMSLWVYFMFSVCDTIRWQFKYLVDTVGHGQQVFVYRCVAVMTR